MKTDIKALGQIKVPQIFAPKLDPQRVEWYVAGFFSLLWIAGLGTYGMGYFSRASAGGSSATLIEVAIFVSTLFIPVMCLWAGAFVLNWSRRVNEQTAKLIDAVEELQSAVQLSSPASAQMVISSVTDAAKDAVKSETGRINSQLRIIGEDARVVSDGMRKLVAARGNDQTMMEELVQTARTVTHTAARTAEEADAARSTTLSRLAREAMGDDKDQVALPFDDEETPPHDPGKADLSWENIVRALNFPSDSNDRAAFVAIRAVMPHRGLAKLLRRSEALLGLLAEEGIYMDDLSTSATNPEDWRAFANGTRGKSLDGLGAVRDTAAVALAKGRMRNDPEFRDQALEFLREFDKMLQEFVDEARTMDLIALGNTRTGRAFQLLARITGAFD